MLDAFDHASRLVLAHLDAGDKRNEITCFQSLLGNLLTWPTPSSDGMHTQRGRAEYLASRDAHHIVIGKGNQKKLRKQLKALPGSGFRSRAAFVRGVTAVARSAASRFAP
ncbi:hypothetical protein [Streptomyces sp. NBC_01751]|uniref:hypothetical protein n=1 Tax=Streptomyces sp. NBC_01751 TaxID=2975929 RepID=UPI002DDB845E|nr:hypothetical protein [Streptomyces sp. NBC_01751]WSD28931.1 hypothetical protein OHA26_38840 [Streptomyces sp. NBC_01751]